MISAHKAHAALTVMVFGLLHSSVVMAAKIDKINKTNDRIIVELSQAELRVLEVGQERVVEIGRDGFVRSGMIQKINVLKETALLVFETPYEGFRKGDQVRFLSSFWNAVNSPIFTTPAQYHQQTRSLGSVAVGTFGETVKVSSNDGKKRQATGDGTTLALQGYLLFEPEWFGGGLGYERRNAAFSFDEETIGYNVEVTLNILRPYFWVGSVQGYRLGMSYDYTVLDRVKSIGGDTVEWNYELAEPVIGLLNFGSDFEWGLNFKNKDEATAVDAKTLPDGASVDLKSKEKAFAETTLHFRRISSPLFVWGMTLGYVLYERELEKDEPLLRKVEPVELLRYRASFEHRLDNGGKFDWSIYYDGAQTRGLSYYAKLANVGGLSFTYQKSLGTGLIVGSTVVLEGGVRQQSDKTTDPATSDTVTTKTAFKRFAYQALIFGQMEFDLLARRGSRHR